MKKVPVKPRGDFGLTKGSEYEATVEELELLSVHKLKWTKDTEGKPILIPNDPTEENRKRDNRLRIVELKKLLADSDYQAIKYAEGLITPSDYAPIKAKREMWRKEINEKEKDL